MLLIEKLIDIIVQSSDSQDGDTVYENYYYLLYGQNFLVYSIGYRKTASGKHTPCLKLDSIFPFTLINKAWKEIVPTFFDHENETHFMCDRLYHVMFNSYCCLKKIGQK